MTTNTDNTNTHNNDFIMSLDNDINKFNQEMIEIKNNINENPNDGLLQTNNIIQEEGNKNNTKKKKN